MPSGRREGCGEHRISRRTQEKNMRQQYVSSHSDRWGRSGMGPGPPENEATWSPWGGQISPASTRPPSPSQARPRRTDNSFKQEGRRVNRQTTFGEVDSTLELQRASFRDKNSRDKNSRGRRSSFSELEGSRSALHLAGGTSPVEQRRSASVPTMRGGIKPMVPSVEEDSFKQELASFKYRPNLSPRNTDALGLNLNAGFAAPCGHFPLRTNQHGFCEQCAWTSATLPKRTQSASRWPCSCHAHVVPFLRPAAQGCCSTAAQLNKCLALPLLPVRCTQTRRLT